MTEVQTCGEDAVDVLWLLSRGYLAPEEAARIGAEILKRAGRPQHQGPPEHQGPHTLLRRYGVAPVPGRCPVNNCDQWLADWDGICPIHDAPGDCHPGTPSAEAP